MTGDGLKKLSSIQNASAILKKNSMQLFLIKRKKIKDRIMCSLMIMVVVVRLSTYDHDITRIIGIVTVAMFCAS